MRRLSKKATGPNVAAASTVKIAAEGPDLSPVSNVVISQYLATIVRNGWYKWRHSPRSQSLSKKKERDRHEGCVSPMEYRQGISRLVRLK
jgi:hypothetical protein